MGFQSTGFGIWTTEIRFGHEVEKILWNGASGTGPKIVACMYTNNKSNESHFDMPHR